jgi:hypothetical protein
MAVYYPDAVSYEYVVGAGFYTGYKDYYGENFAEAMNAGNFRKVRRLLKRNHVRLVRLNSYGAKFKRTSGQLKLYK